MIPLGACSLTLLYLIIHCYRETSPSNLGGGQSGGLPELFREGNAEAALAFARQQRGVAHRALSQGLAKVLQGGASESYDTAIDETIAHEENAIAQWILYLSVIANAAPMIGLLGTVSGMIGAFQTMSAGGMGRPELLAGDIGEALITTATGLCIGIPAMVAYSFFNNRLNSGLLECARIADEAKERLFGARVEAAAGASSVAQR